MPTPVLLDRYALYHPVGRGGFATVWAARHTLLGTRHAVKLLDAITPDRIARLEHEGRVQGRLDPSHVVPVTDVVRDGERVGLVMPLVLGCALDALLDVHLLTEAEAHALFLAMLEGVAVAHAAGIVHRDLKPSNVLLDIHQGRVRVRVADFGIARSDEGPALGGFAGSPAYAAPEQHAGADAVDARADLWALGRILVELLLGQRGVPEAVPSRWRPVVRALLAEEPEDRPPTADAVRPFVPSDVADPRVLRVGRPLATALRRLQAQPDDARPAAASTLVTWTDDPLPEHALPPDAGPLVGRQELQARVVTALREGPEPVWLVGPPGIGKTALAVRVARDQLAERAGGAWLVELDGAASVVDALAQVLGVASGSTEVVAESVGARGRCVLVLDAVHDDADGLHEVLRGLRQSAPQARILLTARVAPPQGRVLRVGPLAPPDAVALLRARRGEVDVERARDLVDAVDRVPLAIELMAAREVLPRAGQAVARDLAEAFREAWAPLPDAWKAVLAVSSVFEGPFDVEAARAVWPAGTPVLAWLDGLVRRSAIRPVGEGWFRVLRGVRVLAREEAERRGLDLDAARGRLARHLSAFGRAEALGDLSGPGGLSRRVELGRYRADLIACARWGAEGLEPDAAVDLVLAASRVLVRDGPVRDVSPLIDGVSDRADLTAAHRARLETQRAEALGILGDGDGQGAALRRARDAGEHAGDAVLSAQIELAVADRAVRRRAQAEAEEALRRAEALSDDPRVRAELAFLQGLLGVYTTRHAEAGPRLARAAEAFEALGDHAGAGRARGTLGNVYAETGREDEALAMYEAALATLLSLGERRLAAIVRANLGLLHRQRGDLELAARTLDEALREHLRVGNQRSAALGQMYRGTTLLLAGDLDGADAAFGEAERRLTAVGNRFLAADARGQRGLLNRRRGRLEQAETLLRSALAEHDGGVFPEGASTWLRGLAWIASSRGEPWEPLMDRALASTGTHTGRASCHQVRGYLALHHGRVREARTSVEAALAEGVEGARRADILRVHALVLEAEGELDAARDAIVEALDLVAEGGLGEGSPTWRELMQTARSLGIVSEA